MEVEQITGFQEITDAAPLGLEGLIGINGNNDVMERVIKEWLDEIREVQEALTARIWGGKTFGTEDGHLLGVKSRGLTVGISDTAIHCEKGELAPIGAKKFQSRPSTHTRRVNQGRGSAFGCPLFSCRSCGATSLVTRIVGKSDDTSGE